MTVARVAGQSFELTAAAVEQAAAGVEPEPIKEHYVVVVGRRYPPKQVLAAATGLDRADFTTHQARALLRRLGFGVYRRSVTAHAGAPAGVGPHRGAEAAAIAPYQGRWVAQEGLEVIFDADSPDAVVQWLRRHGRIGRVWRIPSSPVEAGSASSTP